MEAIRNNNKGKSCENGVYVFKILNLFYICMFNTAEVDEFSHNNYTFCKYFNKKNLQYYYKFFY